MRVLLVWLLNAMGLLFVANLVAGFSIDGWWAALMAAFVLGLVNILVRPLILLLTLPLNVLTLGLFTLIVNAGMLLLMQSIVKGVTISGWGPALWAALWLWLLNWAMAATTRSNPTSAKTM